MPRLPNEPTMEELRALACEVRMENLHLRQFFNLSLDAFVIFDRETIAYVNPAWTEITGFDRGETIGKHFSAFLCPRAVERLDEERRRWKVAGDAGGQEALVCYRKKGGGEVVLSMNWREVGRYVYATGRPVATG